MNSSGDAEHLLKGVLGCSGLLVAHKNGPKYRTRIHESDHAHFW